MAPDSSEIPWTPDQQPSVAIFSSFRKFMSQVKAARAIFRAHGIYVSTPPGGDPINPDAPYVRFEADDPTLPDYEVQRRVFAKAWASTAIYVICPGGYTGRAASYEVGRAVGGETPLYFSEMPAEPLMQPYANGRIVTAQRLSQMILQGAVAPLNAGQPIAGSM